MLSPLHLKFQQSPRFPFVGQIFDIELWLVNDSGKLQMRHEVPFTIKLGFEGESDSKCDHLLEVVGGTRKIEQNGKCQLKLKLLDVSASFGDAKFVLQASPLLSEHSLVGRGVSSPMVCIRHRLVVENRSQLPTLWYKDKGGKQNCIEIVVKLSDEKGQAVRRSIPLKLQLCYSTGEIVNRQDILEISRDSKLQINEDGFTTLRVRINEVSMRHDGRTFSFSISPDTLKDPSSADISPITCSHVEVRSKITIPKNKRGFDELDDVVNTHHHPHHNLHNPHVHNYNAAVPIPTTLHSKTSSNNIHGNINMNMNANMNKINGNGKINHHTNTPRCQVEEEEESPLKKKRTVRFSEESPISATPSASCSSASSSSSNNQELTEDLIEWAVSALGTLNRMRWTETGREKITERTSEGTAIEISRPVFAISNPNELIEELFLSYEKLSHLHPQLPSSSSSSSSSSCNSSNSPFLLGGGGGAEEQSDLHKPHSRCSPSPTLHFSGSFEATDPTDFPNLPPLESAFPENSLSWGIVDYWTGAG